MLYLYEAFSTFELVTHIWSDKGRLDKSKVRSLNRRCLPFIGVYSDMPGQVGAPSYDIWINYQPI